MSKKLSSFKKEEFKNIYFDESFQLEIFNLFRAIAENTGATYMSYLYENEDKNVRYAFTTNPDWGKVYVEDHGVDQCHLWLNVRKAFLATDTKKYILPWDAIKPDTRKQKSISYDRTDHEIGVNGVSFCSKFSNSREFLGLAPDLKNPKFQLYLSKNMDLIKKLICHIRGNLHTKIVTEEIKQNSKVRKSIIKP